VILIARITPGLSYLIPLFLLFQWLGLLGTLWPQIIIHLVVTVPIVIWIMIGYFETTPIELEEWVPDTHVHRLTDTAPLPPSGDPIFGRRVLMFNGDVEMGVAKPTEELDAFYQALRGNINLHRLATNPLMLTVMTAVHRFERLPDKRVQVYDKCADLLLSTWARLKHTDDRWKDLKMGTDDQKGCLAHLGFVLHQHAQERLVEEPEPVDTPEVSDAQGQPPEQTAVDVPAQFIQREMKHFLTSQDVPLPTVEINAEVGRFLSLVEVEAGLLVERGKDERGEALFGFVHRTFQEYFAALDLDNRRTQDDDPNVIIAFLNAHLHDPHWREVTLLLLARFLRRLTTILPE